MSAFVQPDATEDFALSECHCPGTPHDHDTVTLRTEFAYADLMALGKVHTDLGRIDPLAERAKLLEIGIRGWSFVDDEGEPVPVSLPMILLLKPQIVEPIAVHIDELYQASTEPLPNGSGGQSRRSAPVSLAAYPNRATRRAAKRSTSKSSSSPAGRAKS